ncbi:hypothetical protein [Actinacidiphila rubida]|uniref:Uncharacterized protein n=1 Tax=Actinacidiphila rubida TaxID=310780 RepID=A0A1H8GP82_9ACTN|nr:hypothetical protein [Actinacidiphila rubida]SEN45619.1 hypothetical protein SAMN05216267_1005200 [Actinacidiphila rubida]
MVRWFACPGWTRACSRALGGGSPRQGLTFVGDVEQGGDYFSAAPVVVACR